ncbi:MAG: hypothetical protein F6J95_010640 [Leptolyngbya sp. SIO1E4]|nr:hypothetical protein [Leptolyngbya sp. SIO1E4]
MNLAHTLTDDYVICYQLKQELGCIKLKLWEPSISAPNQDQAEHPYLYAVNFSFKHLSEAEAFLRDHLLVNGAFDVPETDFPKEGQVAILPFPTWGMEQ